MKDMNADPRYETVWLIRRLFRAMGTAADHYLQDDDLTAAQRAVMEFLHPDERLSVPAIAAKYQVSRQHVQVTVNELQNTGLVVSVPNPQHKRSPLMQLSDLGRVKFEKIRRNESTMIKSVFANLSESDIATTRRTLRTLLSRFAKGNLS